MMEFNDFDSSLSREEWLYITTDNCTNETAILDYENETSILVNKMNISTEYPLDYAQPLYGYCMPPLFTITIIANTLIVVVLAKPHMRTPTNTVLMAMALSDMFTILFPAPWLLYMYTFGNHYKPFYPVGACYAWLFMIEVLPNLFHTSSIWLTLLLAIQRYIYVCHAPLARTMCTMSRVLKIIPLIFGLALLHQSTTFFVMEVEADITCWRGQVHHICKKDLAYWVTNTVTPGVYFNIYYWFRVIFVHLLPCFLLIVLNVLLFQAMRVAEITRERLINNGNIRASSRGSECKKMRDSQCTTLMLIVVVTVFLLVEIPLAVLTILHIISSSITEFLDYKVVNVLILFSNFSISASYVFNFAIYTGMSKLFRETFKALFIPGQPNPVGGRKGRCESSKFSVGNGGGRTYTTETAV